MNALETFILATLALIGGLVALQAQSVLFLFVGFELLGLPSYSLVAADRFSLRGTEAGIKYLVLGAVGATFLLIGSWFLFSSTGTLSLTYVPALLSVTYGVPTFVVGLTILLALKLGIAPLHQ